MRKESVFDYINDKEKMLIYKGDLFMLMHTLVSYFAENNAPIEFCADCLKAICGRNMYSHDFICEFADFQSLLKDKDQMKQVRDKSREAIEKKLMDALDKSLKDFYKYLNEDDDE